MVEKMFYVKYRQPLIRFDYHETQRYSCGVLIDRYAPTGPGLCVTKKFETKKACKLFCEEENKNKHSRIVYSVLGSTSKFLIEWVTEHQYQWDIPLQ